MGHSMLFTHRKGLLTALVMALLAALVVVVPAFASHYQASLEGSDFEIDHDANLRVDSASPFQDWASVTEFRQADTPSGKDDNSYSGGAKEDDTCPTTSTGGIPPNKSDLLNFGVHEEAGSPGFLHLFWHRVQEPSGTTLMDFELNQDRTGCGNGANVVRTPGDLLIEYRIDQGGANADIFMREWTGSAWGAEQQPSAVGLATGTINSSPIPAVEADGLGAISPRTFGEASIDLSLIFDEDVCMSFGSAFLKSRSSTSFTSALKDFIAPRDIELSNCGRIDIVKTDDTGAALQGAEFTLYVDNTPTSTEGQTEPGLEDTITTQTCTTDADGLCSIESVLAGSYWVVETLTPANHDTADPQAAVVGVDATVELQFENVRQRGSILVEKVDDGGARLADAEFSLTGGPGIPPAIALTELSTGLFCVDGLVFGNYTVTETVAPPGYAGAPAQSIDVDSKSDCDTRDLTDVDLEFTNSPEPGTIVVEKKDDSDGVLTGAAFTVFVDVDEDGIHDAEETTAAAGPTFVVDDGLDPEFGTVTFANLDPGFYCVVETTTPPGYDTAHPQCVEVTITDGGFNVTLTFVDVEQHKVIVIVCHEGDGTFAAGSSTGSSDALLTEGELTGGGPSEAELCALAGDTPREHDDTVTTTVGH